MVIVLLAHGCEEIEAVTPIDFLRRADITVTTLGINGVSIVGSHGITIHADMPIEKYNEQPTAIIVPGGMPGTANIAASPHATRLLRAHHAEDKLIGALCAAPAVALHPLGILRGRSFTTHPLFVDKATTGRYCNKPLVIDGNLITASRRWMRSPIQ